MAFKPERWIQVERGWWLPEGKKRSADKVLMYVVVLKVTHSKGKARWVRLPGLQNGNLFFRNKNAANISACAWGKVLDATVRQLPPIK